MKSYKRGVKILTLDGLAECEFIFFEGKVYHRGWFMSWQFRSCRDFVKAGRIYSVVPIAKEDKP